MADNPALDALRAISQARMAIQAAESKGLDCTAAKELLAQAQAAMSKLDYTGAIDIAGKVPGNIGTKMAPKPAVAPPPKPDPLAALRTGMNASKPGVPTSKNLNKYAGIINVGKPSTPEPAQPEPAKPEPAKPPVQPPEPKTGPVPVTPPSQPEKKETPPVTQASTTATPPRPAVPPVQGPAMNFAKPPLPKAAKAPVADPEPEQPVNKVIDLRPKVDPHYLELHSGSDAERVLSSCERMHYVREASKGQEMTRFSLPPDDKLTRLPFTHGTEMELMVVKRNGEWIEGHILENHFTYIAEYCRKVLQDMMKDPKTPKLIRDKTAAVWTDDINEVNHIRGRVCCLNYKLGDKTLDIELIGRDPHGVGVTWLLEAVTPPCEYVEELEWWIHTLLQVCHRAVLEVPMSFFSGELLRKHGNLKFEETDLVLISSGMNPVNKFVTGISFGDHHHIGIPDPKLRLEVYNMFRNFLPHLIALSVNSPFESGKAPDIKFTKNRIVSQPLSHRLANNEGQLCSGEAATHIPHLGPESTPAQFTDHVQKSDDESARLVEMYPFTHYGTVEIRVFDGQLTVEDRIGMALLMQALALKTQKMHMAGQKVPEVSAVSLVENRKRAVKKGALLGFKKDPDLPTKDLDFARFYQEKIAETGFQQNVSRMTHALSNFLWFVKDELKDMGALETSFLDTFLISIYGGNKFKVNPPLSQAQFQLFLFNKICEGNFNKLDGTHLSLIEELSGIMQRITSTKRYNPMVEEFGAPLIPAFMFEKNIQMSFFTKGDMFALGSKPVSITIKNRGEEPIENVEASVKAFDSDHKQLVVRSFPIGTLAPNDERFLTLPLDMSGSSPYYTVQSEVFATTDGDRKKVASFVRNLTTDLMFTQVAYIGEDNCKVDGPTLIPFLVKMKYNASSRMKFKGEVALVESATNKKIHTTNFDFDSPQHREHVWAPSTNMIKDNIVEILLEMPHETIFIQPVQPKAFAALPAKCKFVLTVTDEHGHVVGTTDSDEFILN